MSFGSSGGSRGVDQICQMRSGTLHLNKFDAADTKMLSGFRQLGSKWNRLETPKIERWQIHSEFWV